MAQVVFDWRELPESELALFEYPSSGQVRSLVTTDCTVQDALVTLHHNIQQIKTGGGDVEKAFQGARDAAGFICRAYSSLEHVKWPLQGRIASELIRRLDKQLQLYLHGGMETPQAAFVTMLMERLQSAETKLKSLENQLETQRVRINTLEEDNRKLWPADPARLVTR